MKKVFATLMLILLLPSLAWGGCWRNLGKVEELSETRQCEELKNTLAEMQKDKKDGCLIFAFSWEESRPGGARVHTYVLFDGTINDIFRVQVTIPPSGGRGIAWEMWTGVSPAVIMAKDPSEGLQFKNYTRGRGMVPLMLEAREFVDNHAAGPAFRNTAF